MLEIRSPALSAKREQEPPIHYEPALPSLPSAATSRINPTQSGTDHLICVCMDCVLLEFGLHLQDRVGRVTFGGGYIFSENYIENAKFVKCGGRRGLFPFMGNKMMRS
ncbi:MAG: hypothetical protein RLY31_1406 [Bacteroidota bacterium]|jgi:hypothetical protein